MYYPDNVSSNDTSFWKYLTVIIVTFIAMQLTGGIIAGLIKTAYLLNTNSDFAPEIFSNIPNMYEAGLPKNLVLTAALLPFVALLFIAKALVGKMHGQTFAMTINGRQTIRWNHVFAGFGIWFLLMFLYLSINLLVAADNFVIRFDLDRFIPLLVISLLLIPFQTTFEEYIFRGYIAQCVGLLTKSRLLMILVPGLLFGLAHYSNSEVDGHAAVILQYIIFGLFFGLIAVCDDGIELPVGIHAANNIFVCLLVTNKTSTLQTPAVFEQMEVSHLAETVGLLLAVSLTVFYFHRRYKWRLNVIKLPIKNSKRI